MQLNSYRAKICLPAVLQGAARLFAIKPCCAASTSFVCGVFSDGRVVHQTRVPISIWPTRLATALKSLEASGAYSLVSWDDSLRLESGVTSTSDKQHFAPFRCVRGKSGATNVQQEVSRQYQASRRHPSLVREPQPRGTLCQCTVN